MRKLRHTMQLSTCARVTAGLTAVLSVALVLALPVRADQVTFHDLTDKVTATITSSTSGSKIKIEECGMLSVSLQPGKSVSVEGCLATITGPANSESFEAPLLSRSLAEPTATLVTPSWCYQIFLIRTLLIRISFR